MTDITLRTGFRQTPMGIEQVLVGEVRQGRRTVARWVPMTDDMLADPDLIPLAFDPLVRPWRYPDAPEVFTLGIELFPRLARFAAMLRGVA